jgi:quercetin dioxygenase-like cupin family protein
MRIRVLVPFVAAAGLLSLTAVGGTAHATAPSGATTELLSRATITGTYEVHIDGIKLHLKGPVDIATVRVTLDPGGSLGWHSHPGATLVAVTSGTVTRVNAPGCTEETVSAGQGFAEEPNLVHNLLNKTTATAQTIATFIVPAGAPLRVDETAPPGCNP